jgi:hypothetical protein
LREIPVKNKVGTRERKEGLRFAWGSDLREEKRKGQQKRALDSTDLSSAKLMPVPKAGYPSKDAYISWEWFRAFSPFPRTNPDQFKPVCCLSLAIWTSACACWFLIRNLLVLWPWTFTRQNLSLQRLL